mgnify:CR=1 FL=1
MRHFRDLSFFTQKHPGLQEFIRTLSGHLDAKKYEDAKWTLLNAQNLYPLDPASRYCAGLFYLKYNQNLVLARRHFDEALTQCLRLPSDSNRDDFALDIAAYLAVCDILSIRAGKKTHSTAHDDLRTTFSRVAPRHAPSYGEITALRCLAVSKEMDIDVLHSRVIKVLQKTLRPDTALAPQK